MSVRAVICWVDSSASWVGVRAWISETVKAWIWTLVRVAMSVLVSDDTAVVVIAAIWAGV